MTIVHVALVNNFGHSRSKLKSIEVSEAESATVFIWNWEKEEPIPMGLLERASLNHNTITGSRSNSPSRVGLFPYLIPPEDGGADPAPETSL